MSVAQFEALCDAGKISANAETFVLEMTPTDRAILEEAQPGIYQTTLNELSRVGFDVQSFERVAVCA